MKNLQEIPHLSLTPLDPLRAILPHPILERHDQVIFLVLTDASGCEHRFAVNACRLLATLSRHGAAVFDSAHPEQK